MSVKINESKNMTMKDLHDTNKIPPSQASPPPFMENVIQFEFNELTCPDICAMLPPPSNDTISSPSTMARHPDTSSFPITFERSISPLDEVLTHTNFDYEIMHSTDCYCGDCSQMPKVQRASRHNSVDPVLLDMLLNPDTVPFCFESEWDQLYNADDDDIIFQSSGETTFIGNTCSSDAASSDMEPIPFCDQGICDDHQYADASLNVVAFHALFDQTVDCTALLYPTYGTDTNLETEFCQDTAVPSPNPVFAEMNHDITSTTAPVVTCKSSKKKQSQENNLKERQYIGTKCRDTDVLCGRGESVNRHPGHKLFHAEKKLLQTRYLHVGTARREKGAIARKLVQVMHEKYNSRFLDFCKEKGEWYIISMERALEKAKQVLREASFTTDDRREKRRRYFHSKKPRS